ncbi:MAG: RluA family pseudouridine synthase [Deltaproteobacteria bacterium]|nr:RluA family pseudouridine synthase [Deltaproteobacteria bacterium]
MEFVWPDEIPRDAVATLFSVAPERANVRLDRFIVSQLPRMSRSKANKIARHFSFDHTGRKLSPAKIVRTGEKIVLYRPKWDEPEAPREIEILYEDEAIVVINKPAGLPVHPTARYLRNTVTAVLDERYGANAVRLCHRLDKETSGVLVAARNLADEQQLKRAFAEREMNKKYLAIVRGLPPLDSFVVNAPLALANHEVGVLMHVTADGLTAMTGFDVIERLARHSLVRCSPRTGRQHQIRVHLAHVGHPIVGDKLYAHDPSLFIASIEGRMTPEQTAELEMPRQALHAESLTFEHPRSRRLLEITAPMPVDFREFLLRQRELQPRPELRCFE